MRDLLEPCPGARSCAQGKHARTAQSARGRKVSGRPPACDRGDGGGHGFDGWPLAAEHARADAVSKTREVGVVETARRELRELFLTSQVHGLRGVKRFDLQAADAGLGGLQDQISVDLSTAKLPASRSQSSIRASGAGAAMTGIAPGVRANVSL